MPACAGMTDDLFDEFQSMRAHASYSNLQPSSRPSLTARR
jgi:hypothetical protein